MNTCASKWESFAAATIAQDASAVQKDEMRKAFYAGFVSCLNICSAAAFMSDDGAVAVLEGLHQEMRAFGADLAGRGS